MLARKLLNLSETVSFWQKSKLQMNKGVRFRRNCDTTSVGVLRDNLILSELIL